MLSPSALCLQFLAGFVGALAFVAVPWAVRLVWRAVVAPSWRRRRLRKFPGAWM